MDKPVEFRAKIFSVAYKSKFDEALKPRLGEIANRIEQIIFKSLKEFGELAVQITQSNLSDSSSGYTYEYINENGQSLFTHTASSSGSFPNKLTGLLKESIDYKVHTSDSTVELGVFSDEQNKINTIAFIPQKRQVVVGSGSGTSVKDYALYLEEGTSGWTNSKGFTRKGIAPKHFLFISFNTAITIWKEQFALLLHEELASKLRRKKIPIYFRIKVKGK